MVDILLSVLTVLGLTLFEITSSLDNAVINADVLATMSKKARRWFLVWGMIIAVFVVRGAVPLLIVLSLSPSIGLREALLGAFSGDPMVSQVILESAPPLLIAGGVFLIFLFFHWLFLEPKYYGLWGEEFVQKKGAWFFAVVSIILSVLIWGSIQVSAIMAFGAAVGSTLFFVVHGFRDNAERQEKQMIGFEGGSGVGDLSKLLFLEVIDASFSIDGVLGAFAYTFSVPLILIGNGVGAIVIRQLTARNIESVKKYRYLKNGAMYSILLLGCVMVADAFGANVPEWVSPAATIIILAYFFYRSRKELQR